MAGPDALPGVTISHYRILEKLGGAPRNGARCHRIGAQAPTRVCSAPWRSSLCCSMYRWLRTRKLCRSVVLGSSNAVLESRIARCDPVVRQKPEMGGPPGGGV